MLEALCPRLVALARIFIPLTPSIGPEDIEQQLVVVTLEAAARINISSLRFIQRRLALEAAKVIDRWLERGLKTPSLEALAWEMDERELRRTEALFELAELGRLSNVDVSFMLRLATETETSVAARMGVSINALRCRRKRCEARLRLQRDSLDLAA